MTPSNSPATPSARAAPARWTAAASSTCGCASFTDGRDGLPIPLRRDAFRKAGGQIVAIRVLGPASYPRFQSVISPRVHRTLRSLGSGALRPDSGAGRLLP
ncbi:MAG TPA: hypothetical protein VF590_17295 [Isosphaeraceae bacterium]